jgi:DNA-binding transcriptional LysR family regulator
MDWSAITFDWTRVRAFLVTAEEGSLSAAARALGATQPTLGRQVAALEQELGVTLFTRRGKALHLTQAGRALRDHAAAMGAAATRFSLAAAGQRQEVGGTVTVTASCLYASELLPPVIARLRAEAPALRVILKASDAVEDLGRHEADIAIRHVRPDSPDLIARLVAEDRAALYATPECLAPFAPVEGPGDLTHAPFLGYDLTPLYGEHLARAGLHVPPESFVAYSADHRVLWRMCQAGIGIATAPCWLGDADRRVVRVLPGAEPLVRFPVWLVAHAEVLTAPAVRLVKDRLAHALAALGRPGAGDVRLSDPA